MRPSTRPNRHTWACLQPKLAYMCMRASLVYLTLYAYALVYTCACMHMSRTYIQVSTYHVPLFFVVFNLLVFLFFVFFLSKQPRGAGVSLSDAISNIAGPLVLLMCPNFCCRCIIRAEKDIDACMMIGVCVNAYSALERGRVCAHAHAHIEFSF